jgi:hypothetical protein
MLKLSVDDRKDKPFHCDRCGDSYEPCIHWSQPRANLGRTLALHPSGRLPKLVILSLLAVLSCSASTIIGFEDWQGAGSDRDFNDMEYTVTGLTFDTYAPFVFTPPPGYSETPFPQPAQYFDWAYTASGSTSITFLSSQTSGNDSVWLSVAGGMWQEIGTSLTLSGIAPGEIVDFRIDAGGHDLYAYPFLNRDGLGYAVVHQDAPEPETWVGMLIGLTLGGISRYIRNRRV